MIDVLQYLSLNPCMDNDGRSVKAGTLITVHPTNLYGYDSNLEYSFTLRQLRNTEFFTEVPYSPEDEATITVLVSGKQPFMKSTFKINQENAGEKIFGLMEFIKTMENTASH